MPDRTGARTRVRQPTAVIVGGSATGLFAAAALVEFFNVVIVERDALPDAPERRRGLPQGDHAHLVWSGGVSALNELVPGLVDELVASGARLTQIMGDMVSRAPNETWFRRFTSTHHANLVCSRHLFDHVLRQRVLKDERITLRQNAVAHGLEGDATSVRGVRIRTGNSTETLDAALVVDASGRGSQAPRWLRDLGLPQVREATVNAGVRYATRLFEAPGRTADIAFPVVNVQANPAKPPGQGGVILPIENGRWIVTLSGTRGGEPTDDPDAFVEFALGLSDPVIGELLRSARPLGPVLTSRSTANRRRHYEEFRRWPDGFVVLGDAVARYNPTYGHGLTVAAQCALAVRDTLRSGNFHSPGTARHLQRAASRPVAAAWSLAIGQDALYPGATDAPPRPLDRLLARYLDRCVNTGATNPRALGALLDVMSLERAPSRLFAPDMIWPMLLGRRKRPLTAPPLTEGEMHAALS
ncbi:FAD-dependent oxidoreductase [Streptomyces sp. NPDC020412]|uniref:FAD-dependent oxidoreductase n=1 Tax=Streptomyces sp. NPDC020412 TaxID=3365073 RepID=UPI0037B23825